MAKLQPASLRSQFFGDDCGSNQTSAIWRPRPPPPTPAGRIQRSRRFPFTIASRGTANGAISCSIFVPKTRQIPNLLLELRKVPGVIGVVLHAVADLVPTDRLLRRTEERRYSKS